MCFFEFAVTPPATTRIIGSVVVCGIEKRPQANGSPGAYEASTDLKKIQYTQQLNASKRSQNWQRIGNRETIVTKKRKTHTHPQHKNERDRHGEPQSRAKAVASIVDPSVGLATRGKHRMLRNDPTNPKTDRNIIMAPNTGQREQATTEMEKLSI